MPQISTRTFKICSYLHPKIMKISNSNMIWIIHLLNQNIPVLCSPGLKLYRWKVSMTFQWLNCNVFRQFCSQLNWFLKYHFWLNSHLNYPNKHLCIWFEKFVDINKCQIDTYTSLFARFADIAPQKWSKPKQHVS